MEEIKCFDVTAEMGWDLGVVLTGVFCCREERGCSEQMTAVFGVGIVVLNRQLGEDYVDLRGLRA